MSREAHNTSTDAADAWRRVKELELSLQVHQQQIRILKQTIDQFAAQLLEARGFSGQVQSLLEELETDIEAVEPRDESLEARAATPQSERADQTGHGPTAQPDLPYEEVELKLDEADRVCESCGGQLEEWDGHTEDSEEITFVRARFVRQKVKRQKYRCKCGGHIETALPRVKPIRRGRYTLEFGSHVVVNKYVDHLPLERQVKMMRRRGLKVRSQTLWDQTVRIADILTEHHRLTREKILNQSVIGIDQTSWPKLMKGSRQLKPWQMWVLRSENAVYYTIREDKSESSAHAVLGDYAGVVVGDQLSTHLAAEKRGAFRLAGCWAHIVRRFRKANGKKAAKIRSLLSQLYKIEMQTRGDPKQRKVKRATQSREILHELKECLWEAARAPKSTQLGEAARYAVGAWNSLERFVDDPDIWIDNNPTERSIRGPVVGRKNHYGSKSKRGTRVASVLYTVLETAKLNGHDPEEWLTKALHGKLLYNEIIPPWAHL